MINTIFAFTDRSPKYKQIYEQFKLLIEHGDIKADEPLPSIRHLAQSLQVSRNTTLMAYEQLVAEGYIRGEGRKGYFANEIEPLIFQEAQSTFNHKQTKPIPPVRIDFRADVVDQSHFPLKTWRIPVMTALGKLFEQLVFRLKRCLFMKQAPIFHIWNI